MTDLKLILNHTNPNGLVDNYLSVGEQLKLLTSVGLFHSGFSLRASVFCRGCVFAPLLQKC